MEDVLTFQAKGFKFGTLLGDSALDKCKNSTQYHQIIHTRPKIQC